MSDITWNDLSGYEKHLLRKAYLAEDRRVAGTSQSHKGLLRKGLFMIHEADVDGYELWWSITAAGCDVYERWNAEPLPDGGAGGERMSEQITRDDLSVNEFAALQRIPDVMTPRQQLLEDFYALMVSIDALGDIKEQLMNDDVQLDAGRDGDAPTYWELESALLSSQKGAIELLEQVQQARAQLAKLQAQNAARAAQWESRRARIIRLRRALKDIEKTSGDGRTVLDAKDALAEDDTLAASQRPPAKAGGLQIT